MKEKLFLFYILSVLIFSGCFSPEKQTIATPDYPCTAGNLRIEKAPEKIAVLSPELENVIRAFGLENKITATADSSGTESEYKIGNEYYPNINAIIESEAEYLFTALELSGEALKTLSDGGVRAFVLSPPKTIADLEKIYKDVALMFYGANLAEEKAAEAFAPYKAAIEELKTKTSGATFIYLSNRELSQPINSFAYGILKETFTPASENMILSAEEIASLNPTYIFADTSLDESFIRSLSVAEDLTALNENKLIALPSDFFSSLMPETINALHLLLFP